MSALAEYKMESVTPGLTAWYSSGDDANVNNGSERLPTINPDVKVTSYGFDGTNFCRAQQVLGTSVDGTFGIVGHLKASATPSAWPSIAVPTIPKMSARR